MSREARNVETRRRFPGDPRTVWLAAVLIGVTVGGAAPAGAASTAADHTTRRAPCTKHALDVGVHRGATPFHTISGVYGPWGCAGRIAYGNFTVAGNDITIVFVADRRGWKTANRGKVCTSGDVPKRIYHNACAVN